MAVSIMSHTAWVKKRPLAQRSYVCLSPKISGAFIPRSVFTQPGPQAASRAAKKIGRRGQTCSPDCDRLAIQSWEIADATAGVHRGAWKRGGVAGGDAGSAARDAGHRFSQPLVR